MLPRILVLALCCSLICCKDLVQKYKRSNSGLSSLDKKVLYDFRNPSPGLIENYDTKAIHTVMAHVPECRQHSDPKLAGMAQGSFTYAAEDEQAYLVANACGTTSQLQVYSGEKLVASIETVYTHILKTTDLNHDDKNELLLAADSTANHELTREASLVEVDRNSLRQVESFGIVYHYPCPNVGGIGEPEDAQEIAKRATLSEEAVVLYYLPHAGKREMPSFTAERYRAPCPASPNAAPSGWKLASP